MVAPDVNESQKSIASWLSWLFERDPIGHAPSVLTYVHHQIHEGGYYGFGTYLPALDGSVSYLFKVLGTAVATLRPHFIHSLEANGPARVKLFESPSVVADGTLITNPPLFNYKQGAGSSSILEVYRLPNISNAGTLRKTLIVGGTGVGGARSSSVNSTRDENIFQQDKYWLAVIETDSAQIVDYQASWYEKAG